MTTYLPGIPITCDTCHIERTDTGQVPWALGEHRRICAECFQKEFGISIEEKAAQEDREFMDALNRLVPGEVFWLGEPKYVGAFPLPPELKIKPKEGP